MGGEVESSRNSRDKAGVVPLGDGLRAHQRLVVEANEQAGSHAREQQPIHHLGRETSWKDFNKNTVFFSFPLFKNKFNVTRLQT